MRCHPEKDDETPGTKVTPRASNLSAEAEDPPETRSEPRTLAFEDAALVERVVRGDVQAFGSLVAKYQHRVYNLVLRMCGRPADAEELTQDAFVKALERIGQFKGRSEFYTWLFRIAVNLVISHRRRGQRVRFQSLTYDDEGRESQADALTAAMADRRNPAPHAAPMAAETREMVLRALEELDDEFRLVVVLCDMEEMNYARAADVLDVPVGTLKSRLHRARCVLRQKLAGLME